MQFQFGMAYFSVYAVFKDIEFKLIEKDIEIMIISWGICLKMKG